MRIVVLNRHPVFRNGLRALLHAHSGFELVAEGSAAVDALPLFRSARPDVVLMDVELSDGSAVGAIRALRAADAGSRVVVLTNCNDEEHVCAAVAAGAQGYVLKNAEPVRIVDALRAVHAGRRYLDPEASLRLARRIHGCTLTPRERAVLELLVAGARNKAIGLHLGIAEYTVKGHMKNIFGKLGAQGRTEAVSKAIQRGLVHVAEDNEWTATNSTPPVLRRS
jgi:DNA-binding NarL/FixJ family response regulator